MDHRNVGPASASEVSPGPMARLRVDRKFPNIFRRKLALTFLGLLLAAATITYGFVWMYCFRWEPGAGIGLDTGSFSPKAESIEVIGLYPDGPAERAGIRLHDEIVAVDGNYLTAAPSDFLRDMRPRRPPGGTVTPAIRRPGRRELLQIAVAPRAVTRPGAARRVAALIIGSYPIVFMAVSVVVLFLRIADRNAWLLALLCAGFISAPQIPPSAVSMSTNLRSFMFAYRAIFLGMLPFTVYVFFSIFPQRSPLDWRVPWFKWIIALMGVLISVPGIPTGHPQPWSLISGIAGARAAQYGTLTYACAAFTPAALSFYRSAFRATDREAKRKFRIILWGALAGLTPITVSILVSDFAGVRLSCWLDLVDVVCLALFPLSLAHAVLRYRVLELPTLLKESARYILVRRGFAFLLLLFAMSMNVLLGVFFARTFGMQSALATAVGGVLGIVMAWIFVPWVRRATVRIDRKFFPVAYDARATLRRLARSIPAVGSKDELPRLIEREIELALHPSSVAVYLRDAQGILQPPLRRPPLAAVSASLFTANRVRPSKEPANGSPHAGSGSLKVDLAQLQAECLVSVISRSGNWLGLILLGKKLSDEPYSQEDKEMLSSVAGQAGLTLESIDLAERMAEHIGADRRVQQELQIARAIQSKMLPQRAPALATLDYSGKCVQARTVGGDYYDFLDLGAGRVAFVLADVAGKGIAAALLMANLQACLRSLYPVAGQDLLYFLHSVNLLFVRNTDMTHYATAFFGVYDDRSRQLQYANCGHNPPILLRADGGMERLSATATVLGLFEAWGCSISHKQLLPGDTLVIYTDGITEAGNRDRDEFGEERLISLLRLRKGLAAADLLHQILKSVQEFSPGEQGDDLTTIVAIGR